MSRDCVGMSAVGANVSIQDLTRVVPPPAKPVETGREKRWREVEKELKIKFPKDYKEFIERVRQRPILPRL